MRIALFGGSFNPIHKAHINIAKFSIEYLNLDELIFIPCYRSVDKQIEIYASAEDRFNMIQEILPNKCSISRFELDKDIAIESIETIKHFRNIYKDDELFFILGEDSYKTLETWQDYKEFDKLINLVVFRRHTDRKKKIEDKGLKVMVVDNELFQESSKEFRESKNFDLLDVKVVEYIKSRGIY